MTDWSNLHSQITPHFTVGEVVQRSGYSSMPRGPMRVGPLLAITPRRNAKKHARNLEKVRAHINIARQFQGLSETGIGILSWARSWQHNREVGGALFSRHLYFLATDITLQEIERLCPWPNGREFFDSVCNLVFSEGGFGTYPGGNRHVDSRGWRARWSSWVPGS